MTFDEMISDSKFFNVTKEGSRATVRISEFAPFGSDELNSYLEEDDFIVTMIEIGEEDESSLDYTNIAKLSRALGLEDFSVLVEID